MTFVESIQICLQKYVVWQGRARRSEYWWFTLFCFAAGIVLSIIDAITFGVSQNGTGLLSGLFSLATFLPSLSVLVRRLHDTDRSGWWFWLILIPIIGWIILLVFLVSKGSNGDNGYGSDPLGGSTGDYTASSVPSVERD